jgi:HPt (histidine-containing phosphotransfer) domain-containing protein
VSVLDPSAVDGLREIGGDEFVVDLVDTFRAEAPGLVDSLSSSDAEEVRRAAHTLKSNAATFGAADLASLCRELEDLAKTGSLEGAPELAGRIGVELQAVDAALAPSGTC